MTAVESVIILETPIHNPVTYSLTDLSSYPKFYSLQFIYLYSASIKADNVISKVLNRKIINIKEMKTL